MVQSVRQRISLLSRLTFSCRQQTEKQCKRENKRKRKTRREGGTGRWTYAANTELWITHMNTSKTSYHFDDFLYLKNLGNKKKNKNTNLYISLAVVSLRIFVSVSVYLFCMCVCVCDVLSKHISYIRSYKLTNAYEIIIWYINLYSLPYY